MFPSNLDPNYMLYTVFVMYSVLEVWTVNGVGYILGVDFIDSEEVETGFLHPQILSGINTVAY